MKLERLFHERVKGKFHATFNSYLGFKPNSELRVEFSIPKELLYKYNYAKVAFKNLPGSSHSIKTII